MSSPRPRRHAPSAKPLLETTYAGAAAQLLCAEATYGTPRPRILLTLTLTLTLTLARGADGHRVAAAKAYTLAAAVELASLARNARWVVCVQAENGVAWVDLELSEGLPEEGEAGLEAMRAVLLQGGR